MKLFLTCILFVSTLAASSAQTDSTIHSKKIHYFNSIHSGILQGESGIGTTASVSMQHGIRYGRMALSLGVGYDDYTRTNSEDVYFGTENIVRWKAVPVFASFAVDIWKPSANALFFQADVGHSFIRIGEYNNWTPAKNIEGGVMVHPSVGYRIASGRHRLYLVAGYKWQRNRYDYTTTPWVWGYPTQQISVKETMERFTVGIGFGWH